MNDKLCITTLRCLALDMIDKEVEKIQAKFTGGMKMPF